MLKATKIRVYPTKTQKQQLTSQFGAVRWVYNYALAWRSKAWKEDGESVSKFQTINKLVELKKAPDTAWLKDADSQVLQQSVMNLDNAFKKFFKGQARYPRFKNRYDRQSLSYPQRVKIVDGKFLRLPKIGNVKAIIHREIVGQVKTVTISRNSTGKYFASILCDDGKEVPELIKSVSVEEVVGIDLGLTHISIDSDGKKIDNPRFLKKAATNLRRKQKALSRKKKGSANRNKARVLVAKAHEKTTNSRNDFQHKLSKRLIDENQAICVETLKVKNMVKNRRLAKHIADASWGELVRKLEYKAEWSGKHLVKIDQWFPSSKTCSCCGDKIDNLPLNIRNWTCETCGVVHDRDINAALNIKAQGITKLKAEGLSVSACGGSHKTNKSSVVA